MSKLTPTGPVSTPNHWLNADPIWVASLLVSNVYTLPQNHAGRGRLVGTVAPQPPFLRCCQAAASPLRQMIAIPAWAVSDGEWLNTIKPHNPAKTIWQ